MNEHVPPRPPAALTRGAGALLHTEVERVPLGTHAGHRLTARVEYRTLRLALGRRWHASVALGRRRAVAIEVVGAHAPDAASTGQAGAYRYDGTGRPGGPYEPYEVRVPSPVRPWARYARRAALVAAGCWLLGRAAARLRAPDAGSGAANRAPNRTRGGWTGEVI